MIKFNIPLYIGKEDKHVLKAIKDNKKISGNGEFTKKCSNFIIDKFKTNFALMTPSCTDALEMAAILLDIKNGDEIIMPSYTFVSSANAFVLRGAKIVFVDIRPDTMNINEDLIEEAITERTKAIVPIHYGGVSCEMEKIIILAKKYNLFVIEDAAQGFLSKYNDKYLGTIGDFGCFSFHETKNFTMGEGGALLINNNEFIERAIVIRNKGTDRHRFIKGEVDKYTWIDIGSSFLPSEISCAYLYGQLSLFKSINDYRMEIWREYFLQLNNLIKDKFIEVQNVPENCTSNGHIFYIKLRNKSQRDDILEFLKSKNIQSVFHYIPLHSSLAGLRYGKFKGEDIYTTKESERLLRLPLHYELKKDDVKYICDCVKEYFNNLQ